MKNLYSAIMLLTLLLSTFCMLNIPPMDASEQTIQRLETSSEEPRGTVVTVEPATVIVPVGGTFDIAIKIADVENLFGFDVRMSWNPSIVKYVSHTVTVPVESYPDGVLYRPIYLVKDEANESGTPTDPESLLLVAYLSLPSAPSFNGSGTMLAVSFEVVGTGTCELALTNVDLTTPDARVIMREVQSGYFESSTSDHDVAVFLDVPKHVWPRTMIGINATVVNAGTTAETDIMFQLMINSELVDMAFVPLDSAERHVLSYLWMPINEAFHNVTAYAIPVIDETYLDNNIKKIDVLVAEHIKVPAHFPSIQMAIDVASPGATVRVSEGTYREYLVINKRIALIGEGEMTVVDAMGTAYAIEVNEGDSRVEGFSIMNGTRCGIFVTRAENVDIFHNIIKEMPKCYAVFLTHSNNVNIKSNTMTEVREGISLDSSQNNILMWNNITGAKMAGISLSNSDHNYILANELRCCNTGVAVGLITTQQAAYNNTVKRNEISECGTGIAIHRGTGNTIIQNRISRNEWGVLLVDTTNNRIYHNNFIANTIQAEACLGNIWQSSDNQGNYWDDYTGEDLDGDGVGDTLIPHQGVDSYPLVDPWNALNADLTVDDRVDLFDLEFVASAYGVADCDPKWFPQADLAPQWGRIDILDAVTAAYYYSEQP